MGMLMLVTCTPGLKSKLRIAAGIFPLLCGEGVARVKAKQIRIVAVSGNRLARAMIPRELTDWNCFVQRLGLYAASMRICGGVTPAHKNPKEPASESRCIRFFPRCIGLQSQRLV